MHMKTHFSSISSYCDLSLSDFLKLASLMYNTYVYGERARDECHKGTLNLVQKEKLFSVIIHDNF